MEDLIFVLPIFLLFFFIMFKIFSLFKKVFDFIRKNFDLTIDQAGEEIEKINNKMDNYYSNNEDENQIIGVEKKSIAESKKRFSNQHFSQKNQNSSLQKTEKIEKEKLSQKKIENKNNSFGKIFSQYTDLEKAVIYNEILSKPKAFKRD